MAVIARLSCNDIFILQSVAGTQANMAYSETQIVSKYVDELANSPTVNYSYTVSHATLIHVSE